MTSKNGFQIEEWMLIIGLFGVVSVLLISLFVLAKDGIDWYRLRMTRIGKNDGPYRL